MTDRPIAISRLSLIFISMPPCRDCPLVWEQVRVRHGTRSHSPISHHKVRCKRQPEPHISRERAALPRSYGALRHTVDLSSVSSSEGTIGFRVNGSQPRVVAKGLLDPAVLQRVKTDHGQPPAGRRQSGRRRRAISSDFNSSFTAIRRAWKVRVAGSMRSCRDRGTQRRTSSASSAAVSIGFSRRRSTIARAIRRL